MKKRKTVASSQSEFTQYFPEPSWVEHDANEIWEKQLQTIRTVIRESGIKVSQIAAIGITNQRETTVVWDSTTGEPVSRAIVWQCRRTAPICEELKQIEGFSDYIHENTGF
jgi:glycerol kinase